MELGFQSSSAAYATWSRIFLSDNLLNGDSEILVVKPRGYETREYLQASTHLKSPHNVVPFLYGRRPNYFGMLMECFWPLTTINDLALLSNWNEALSEFSDDGETMSGAYGVRMNQVEHRRSRLYHAINKIEKDRDSRQAVVPIYNPSDTYTPSKDTPCNTQLMFKVRDDNLYLTVINRSNDLHLGLFGVNVPQFYFVGSYIAGHLGAKLYRQVHYSDSLHVYLGREPQNSINNRIIEADFTYLDFYKYWNPYTTLDREMGIESGGRHVDIDDYYGQLLRNAASSGVIFSGRSPTIGAMYSLLRIYAEHKRRRKLGPLDVVEEVEFYRYFFARIEEDITASSRYKEKTPSIPFDWVFACLSTLVHRVINRSGNKEDRFDIVEHAMGAFNDFAKKYGEGDLLQDEAQSEMRLYLING